MLATEDTAEKTDDKEATSTGTRADEDATQKPDLEENSISAGAEEEEEEAFEETQTVENEE